MASLSSILSVARTALFTHQTAVSVASHNIGNAQTEGYSRQKAMITPSMPQRTTYGMLGTGVRLEDIERVRNPLLDQGFRRESSKAASHDMQHDLLQQIEDVFAEPSDSSLGSSMDVFWNSWSDLANQPTSASARFMVRQRGGQLVDALNLASKRVTEVEDGIRGRLSSAVDELNQIGSQIADLNVQLTSLESGGQTAGDLRDTRDRLIDRAAQLGPVRVLERSTGGVAVLIGEELLVDGSTARSFGAPEIADGRWILPASTGDPLRLARDGGEIGGMLGLLNTDIAGTRADLDALARGLVETVNAMHRQGWTAAGDALGGSNWDETAPPTGSMVDFFEEPADPADITALNLSLSQAVIDDEAVIAAGYTQGSSSDNALALDLAALRDDRTSMEGGTTSFAGFYRDMVTGLALQTKSAENSSTVYTTLASQAETRRQSVSGVSIDEELVLMMQHQQAYTAASRVINTVDEMMQTLLQI